MAWSKKGLSKDRQGCPWCGNKLRVRWYEPGGFFWVCTNAEKEKGKAKEERTHPYTRLWEAYWDEPPTLAEIEAGARKDDGYHNGKRNE